MKLRFASTMIAFAALALLVTACAPLAPAQPTPDVLAPTDSPSQPTLRAVQVQSVIIQVLQGQPAQVSAIVRGNLSDACATLQPPQLQYANGTFTVTLMSSSPAGAACAQVVTPFETTIPFTASDLPAGNYTVTVNGVSAVFTLKAEAPASTATAAPTSTPVPLPTSAGCRDAAAFVSDVSVPDNTQVAPGAEFVKIWRLRNTGTCAWNSSYVVAHVDGASLTDSAEYTLTGGRVDPGQTVDINVGMRAPTQNGTYTSYWALRGRNRQLVPVAGGHEGNSFFVKIRVGDSNASVPSGNIIAYSADAVVTKGTACTADAEYQVTASFTADGPVNVNFEVTSKTGNDPSGYFLSDIGVQAASVNGVVVLGPERFSHGEGPQGWQVQYRFGAPFPYPNDITFMVRTSGSAWHSTKLPCP